MVFGLGGVGHGGRLFLALAITCLFLGGFYGKPWRRPRMKH